MTWSGNWFVVALKCMAAALNFGHQYFSEIPLWAYARFHVDSLRLL